MVRACPVPGKILAAAGAAWFALAPCGAGAADKNAPPSQIVDPPRPAMARPAPAAAPPSRPSDSPDFGERRADTRIKRRSYVNSKRNRERQAVTFEQKQREEAPPDAAAGEPRDRRDMVSEPWLSPTGERLVAVVGERTMTKPELDLRVNLVLKDDPLVNKRDWQSQQELSDKRIEISQTILQSWVEMTTLALEAERTGIKASPDEVEASLAELASGSDIDLGRVRQQAKLIGIPQEQLRTEARDGLLVEKYVLKIIRATDRKIFEDLYKNNPGQFLLPPQARVFHVYRALDPAAGGKDQKKAKGDLERLRKALNKASSEEDYEALTKQSDEEGKLSIGDMGWVSADMGWLSNDTDTQSAMIGKIFSTKVGEVSDVFSAGNGLHVIKVLERTEGSKPTLEDAMPQIEAFMFEKTKGVAYDLIRSKYKININSGGLNRWREAGDVGEGAIMARPAAKTAAPAAKPAAPKLAPAPPPPAMKPQEPAETPEVSLDLLPSLETEAAPQAAKPAKKAR